MCDMDMMEFCRTSEPKARKEHHCYECHGVIAKGETYFKMTYKYDGHIGTEKRCLPCEKLQSYVVTEKIPFEGTYSHTGCLYFGELHEAVRQSPELIPEEMLSPKMKELRDKALAK